MIQKTINGVGQRRNAMHTIQGVECVSKGECVSRMLAKNLVSG